MWSNNLLRKFSKKYVKYFECNASLSVTFRYFGMYPRLFRMVSDFLKIKVMRMSKNNIISKSLLPKFSKWQDFLYLIIRERFPSSFIYFFTICLFFFLEGWWWYCFKIWKSKVFRFCFFFFGSFIFENILFFFFWIEIFGRVNRFQIRSSSTKPSVPSFTRRCSRPRPRSSSLPWPKVSSFHFEILKIF